ncbi:13516_t:CDS:2, partial [Gigaspora rosea]
ETQISEEYCGSDPNSIWEKIDMLIKWTGITLFGLDNYSVKEKLEQAKTARLLKNIEASNRFLKRDYPKHLHITSYGTVLHNPCINHCLPFVFGNCNKEHTLDCDECNEIFKLFEELQLLLGNKQQE